MRAQRAGSEPLRGFSGIIRYSSELMLGFPEPGMTCLRCTFFPLILPVKAALTSPYHEFFFSLSVISVLRGKRPSGVSAI